MERTESIISIEIFRQVLEAVNFLHTRKVPIIHRNLKSANILVSIEEENIRLKLGDFFSATLHCGDLSLLLSHTRNTQEKDLGTLAYMAPEMHIGFADTVSRYNYKVDLYSLEQLAIEIFDYDIYSEFPEKQNILLEPILKKAEAMLSPLHSSRPSCMELLQSKDLWPISSEQIDRKAFFEFFLECGYGMFSDETPVVDLSKIVQANSSPESERLIISSYEEILAKNFIQIKYIGKGSFGYIFRGMRAIDATESAIKIIGYKETNIIQDSNSVQITYFDLNKNEVLLMEKMSKSTDLRYIVQYKSHWFVGKDIYMEMELCQDSLDKVLDKKVNVFGKNPVNDRMKSLEYFFCLEIFIELLECLNYIHSLNPPVVHRDLKPSNVLIATNHTNGHYLKLSDFGGAKELIDNKTRVVTMIQITAKYAANELLWKSVFNTKADVFSLGIIGINLFNLDIDSDHSDVKLRILSNLFASMLSPIMRNRPNCKDILDSIHLNCELSQKELIELNQKENYPETLLDPENEFYLEFINIKLLKRIKKGEKLQ